MNDYCRVLGALRPTEMTAFRTHQERIAVRDKNKRRRAMQEYRKWLDYMVQIERITPRQRVLLECYRMNERHV